MTQRSCCVPRCLVKLGDGVLLHRFPNPSNPAQIKRFCTWVMKIGGDIVKDDNIYIYRNRKVCHRHFQDEYIFPSLKLSALAIPTLHIPEELNQVLYPLQRWEDEGDVQLKSAGLKNRVLARKSLLTADRHKQLRLAFANE